MTHNHSRVCNCLHSNALWILPYNILITSQLLNFHGTQIGFSDIMLQLFMKSGLSKFFAQMTNVFPPSIAWARKQLFLNSSRVRSLSHHFKLSPTNMYRSQVPSARLNIHQYTWLADVIIQHIWVYILFTNFHTFLISMYPPASSQAKCS